MRVVVLNLTCLALAGAAANAQVVTDGTLGPATTVAGPNALVPASLGQTRGSNLFHSFTQLDISPGESVTFQGPRDVRNVLARVTGGSPSNINGALRCEILGADVYLINPAGVVIGPAGTLQIRGSFHVASAAYVRLGNDGKFDAVVPADSVLTTSAPAAFGFANGSTSADVLVRGNLGVEPGNGVSVVAGGTLRIVGGELLAESGAINVAAVRQGEVALTQTPRGTVIDTTATADPRGDVDISAGGIVDASGPTHGLVTIRGGSLRISDSQIVSNSTGGTAGAAPDLAVDVRLAAALNIDPGAAIFALASGDAPGGEIRIVTGGDVTIDGGGRPGTNGVATRSSGAGSAGAIDISTPAAIHVTSGGDVGSTSEGPGRGGDVKVFASALDVDAAGQIFAQARAAGDGGNIDIQTIGAVELTGPGSSILTATARGSTGRGGDVDLSAGSDLRVTDLAFVSATTNGSGDAGNIRVDAQAVELDGLGKDGFTGVGANTQPEEGVAAGAGGSVTITTDAMTIRDGAGVAARAFGGTQGGSIDLTVTGDLVIDATATGAQTGLTAQAAGTANGGSVVARARAVELRRGQITASADADGGEVTILAPVQVRLTQSEISAEAGGTGGNITIDPQSVILDRSRITANAVRGNGGNITIRTQTFVASADPETAVTASSEFAVAGNVEINAPDTEIAGALVRLSGDLASPNAALQPLCGATFGAGNISTFVATGRGGAPLGANGWQPAFVPTVPVRSPTKALR